jgi:hypothetical protein
MLINLSHFFSICHSFAVQIGDALFVDLPRVRLDGGAKAFRKRWGYELSPPPPLLEEEEEEYGEEDEDGDEDGGGGEGGGGGKGAGGGGPEETVSLRDEAMSTGGASPMGECFLLLIARSPPVVDSMGFTEALLPNLSSVISEMRRRQSLQSLL